jgi:DnaJ-class molecular chaperone
MKEIKTDQIMVCPDCDARGYIIDKNGKSNTCKRCKGEGEIYNDKKEPNLKSS